MTSDAQSEDDEIKPQLLRVVSTVASGTSITVDASPGTYNRKVHPIVRRWDQKLDSDGKDLAPTGGCLPLLENRWLPLQDGIKIWFDAPGDETNYYRGGDYWLIPARTATSAIEWP